jgi:hypothetical protein
MRKKRQTRLRARPWKQNVLTMSILASNDQGSVSGTQGGGRFVCILALVAICISAYTLLAADGVGDKAWLLLAARKWLAGNRLYVDIFEINPPLILYIYGASVRISSHMPWLGDYRFLTLLGLACAMLSAWLGAVLMRLHPAFAGSRRKRAGFALLLALVFIAPSGPPVFFDREHIFLILTFPYLLRFMPSLARANVGNGLAMLIGVMAGVGFCIKPHCLIVFIAVQLICMLRTRKAYILFSLENGMIYAVACLYLWSVFRYTPEYIHTVLPMAMQTYLAAGMQINGLFFVAIMLTILGIAFADFRWRATSPYRSDLWYLLAIYPAFLVYAFANNGWGYTYNPAISFCLVLTGWVRMEYLWLKRDADARGLPARSFLFGARACMLGLFAMIGCSVVGGVVTVSTSCKEHLACSRWGREIIASLGDARSFGAITNDFDIWTHLSDATGARWDTRFNHLWMLPKFLVSGPDFTRQHRWVPEYVAAAFAQDLDGRKPEVVFVDNSDVFNQTSIYVDIIAYLNAYPKFPEAWAHYHHVQSIRSCSHPEKAHCSFEVYRRNP